MPASRFCQAFARSIFPVLLLVGSSFWASAETVAFADLAGTVVEADIHRHQDMRQDGRAFSTQVHQHWKLDVNADKTIDVTVNTTVRGPQGTRKAPPNAGRYKLDEPREIRNRGGGQGAWSFAEGTLHFTRTFPSGAYRAHFALARGEGGITCSVTEGYAREDGNRPITLESPFGGQVTIIRSEQKTSECRVKSAKTQ